MVSLWLVSHEHSTSTGVVISRAVIARHPPVGHATSSRLREVGVVACVSVSAVWSRPLWTWLVVDLRRGAPRWPRPRASRTSRSSFDLFKGGIHPARGIQRTIWPPCLGWRPGGLAQAAANQQTNPEPNQHGRDGVAANQAGHVSRDPVHPCRLQIPARAFHRVRDDPGSGSSGWGGGGKGGSAHESREVVRSV